MLRFVVDIIWVFVGVLLAVVLALMINAVWGYF